MDAVAGSAVTFNNTSSKRTIPASYFESTSVEKGSTWLPLYVRKYSDSSTYLAYWPFTLSAWINISSCTDGSSKLFSIPNASKTTSRIFFSYRD